MVRLGTIGWAAQDGLSDREWSRAPDWGFVSPEPDAPSWYLCWVLSFLAIVVRLARPPFAAIADPSRGCLRATDPRAVPAVIDSIRTDS